MTQIGQQFTGAAILKLEMEGKLRVNDPISKYLPNVPPDKSGITIHHLLTHTAGLGELGLDDSNPIGRDDMLRRATAMPLLSEPGKRFEYSNMGFSMAAAIVEIVSGKTYERFLHDALFEPAGMKDTGYVLPRWNPDRFAHGYDAEGRDQGTFESMNWGPSGPGWVLVGNGGILSTPRDMHRWHLALLGDSILSKSAKEKYTTPYVPTHAGDHYGYGWGILTTPRNTKLIWHNGGNGIFFTEFRRYVDDDVVIYVNSNGEIRATELGSNELPALVFGEGVVTMPPRIVTLENARRARLAGVYRTDAGEEVRVSADEQGVTVSGTGDALVAMLTGLQPPGGEFARQEDLVRRVIECGATGDFEAVRATMGKEAPPLEQVRTNQGGRWKRDRETLGEYKGLRILGSARRGPVRVIAQILFERGSRRVAYDWMGPELIGVMAASPEATHAFLPQSETEFVWFHPRQSRSTLVRFRVASDGRVEGLTIPTEAGEISATRGN